MTLEHLMPILSTPIGPRRGFALLLKNVRLILKQR